MSLPANVPPLRHPPVQDTRFRANAALFARPGRYMAFSGRGCCLAIRNGPVLAELNPDFCYTLGSIRATRAISPFQINCYQGLNAVRRNHLHDFCNTDFWAPSPEFLIQQVSKRVHEYAFLTSSQLMLMLLVLRPYPDNHCSTGWSDPFSLFHDCCFREQKFRNEQL